MAEKSPFNDGDDSLLLNESKTGNKNGKYDESALKRHWKIVLAGVGVVALISLGVFVGAVFNHSSVSEVDNRKARSGDTEIRLPGNVAPIKYRLYLHPNITDGKFGFKGYVRILILAKKQVNSIVLHSKKLKIEVVKLYTGDHAMAPSSAAPSDEIKLDGHEENEKSEFLTINLGKNKLLDANKKYVVFIKFSSTLSTSLEGFYKSSYKTKSGEKRYLATTHFEATAARKAFPCFDEPAMKANFSIIMIREKQHVALSNMPEKTTKLRNDGLYMVEFEESVKMSTYLVAFVVCDYVSLNGTTKNGVKVKVWAPKDQIEQAEFARDTAVIVLDYYDEFFKVKFPLPKQDLIAIPDFAAGAMENWGLITYRLTSILYDEKESSSANKQWVAVVIAHELAHQWFGNLVTMKWWNDLWLNEGFAAYVEFIGANKRDPKWQMMDQFIIDDTQSSLTLDSHANSHPISVKVHDPAQINEIFDSISYDKGASIIRMLKAFIGSDSFHTGLADYLQKYQYSNAVSDDLWACMTKAQNENNPTAKVDVKSIMDTWTLQMGYPVITIARDPKDEDNAVVTQKRFLVDVDAKSAPSKYDYKWDVPLTFYFQHKPEHQSIWMNRTAVTGKIGWNRQSGWIKANIDQIGFYRVNYDEENWNALSKQLVENHTALSTSDRANLIDDAFELAKANLLPQIKALDMTKYLDKEKEYVPFISAISSIAYIGDLLLLRPGYKYYEKYIVQQVAPLVKELGWEDKGTHLNKYLRGAVLRASVQHNDSAAVTQALNIFNDFMKTNKSIAPNLRSTIYLAGIKYGGKKAWDFMYNIYKTTQFPSEERKIMFSLTDTTDKELLKRYLSWTLDNNKIRSQDSCGVIEHISINPVGTKMAYDFVKKNWDTLYKRYGTGSFDMSGLIKTIFGRAKDSKGLKEAEEFLSSHKTGSGKLAAKQAIAVIKNHIAWLKKNEKDVTNWLKKKVAASA